jgi:hypothetical protein
MKRRMQGLVSRHKELGDGIVYTSMMLIHQHAVAILRNHVDLLWRLPLPARRTVRWKRFAGENSRNLD